MRKLIRAHQRQAREHKKFRRRAVAAGAAAAITLGAGVSLHKAFAAYMPDLHELSVSQDADADLLDNAEEIAIGYNAFKGDQNRNEIPDGVELAKRCAADINELPVYITYSREAEPNGPYKTNYTCKGTESCDVCGEVVNMCWVTITNPRLALSTDVPYLYLHYMEHGSFSGEGTLHSGRVDVPQLLTVLERQYPYDPNEHQLPLDYCADPCDPNCYPSVQDTNDGDGDLLADSEETATGYDPNDADQDNDLMPDGIELAKQCAVAIEQLPWQEEAQPNETYRWWAPMFGLEMCAICGQEVNMGAAGVVNPQRGISVDYPLIALHYMEHGSFSYAASIHNGRLDVPALVQALEMPSQCGNLGTEFLTSDLDDDCEVNLADLGKLTKRWLRDCSYFGTPYILGDLTEDCEIDLADFAGLADQWQQSTDPNQ